MSVNEPSMLFVVRVALQELEAQHGGRAAFCSNNAIAKVLAPRLAQQGHILKADTVRKYLGRLRSR